MGSSFYQSGNVGKSERCIKIDDFELTTEIILKNEI